MSDYNNNGSGRPQGRGRGGPRRGGPRHQSNSTRGGFKPSRKAPEPTGFQKFLSVITFGLYKPQVINYPKSSPPPSQSKPARPEPGPIARGDREAKQANRKERAPKQQPVTTEITHERLYVGNLSYDATESDLFELFKGSGSVRNAEVVVNSRTQRSKGFAFVTMNSVDAAQKAVADLNGKDFMGRPLVVGGAKPVSPREGRPEAQSDEDAITRPEEDVEEGDRVPA